jgi:hypothetical protein
VAKRKVKPKRKPPEPQPAPRIGEVLTIEEAAAFLRVPAEAFRAEVEAGKVGCGRRIAGEWRFTPQGILAWLGGYHTFPA